MIIHSIFFYFFSVIAIFSSLMVITSRSTINSVFFLILDFISVGCLFTMVGAEFLGMILLIVYVGAVAVLFLFVVMMLNINEVLVKEGFLKYFPLGLLLISVFLTELIVVFKDLDFFSNNNTGISISNLLNQGHENTKSLGLFLYTDFFIYFQLAGIVLLIAMIGAIVLTHQRRKDVKRQNILAQIYKDPDSSIELKDIKPGQGL